MSAAYVSAKIVHNSAGESFLRYQSGNDEQPILPPLLPPEDTSFQPINYLHNKYARLDTDWACGTVHAAAHPSRAAFIDVSLWREPALAPTALVPTLPETRTAKAGYLQIELGDEEQLGRYPVLQAIRSGMRLDPQAYTRGTYQTVPLVPGGTAWELQHKNKSPGVDDGAMSGRWLAEYLSDSPPSIPVIGLQQSFFVDPTDQTGIDSNESSTLDQDQDSPVKSTPQNSANQESDGKANLAHLFSGIYLGNTSTGVSQNPVQESTSNVEVPRAPSHPGSDPSPFMAAQNTPISTGTIVREPPMLGRSSAGKQRRQASALLTARNVAIMRSQEPTTARTNPMSTFGPALGHEEDEEARALAEEQEDCVPDLPILDDLEIALRASEAHIVPPEVSRTRSAKMAVIDRPNKRYEWAREKSLADVEAAYDHLRPNMAMSFPFELDHFQKEGVVMMERDESILVAAHTSAGKTVLAEYAFALCELHKTKAVYTAPVKAISNQKFRDLGQQFDVGLLTGDVQIKTNANCLIMTIEILRSMLYRGANLVRDIEWVIFDEVHFVNDDDRGIVYEEVIIMLPPHINIIMLSATVPNKMEFADWVGRTRQKVMNVCGTDKRPVPLSHHLYFKKDIHHICEHNSFDSVAYRKAKAVFENKGKPGDKGGGGKAALPTGRGGGRATPNARGRGGGSGGGGRTAKDLGKHAVQQYNRGGGGGGGPSGKQVWTEMIHMLRDRSLLPAIMFMFSKKLIDQTASSLTNLDLTTSAEKSTIRTFIDRSLTRLSEEDRQLPQILRMSEFVMRGIGAHHAGCLPIIKEVVEMLFCEGLLKVLFATDTFAMGVNAPARTVAFWHINKPTGVQGENRSLRPDEYVQMAGRAGRRGIDLVGTVLVVCHDHVPEEPLLRNMLLGKSEHLKSKFRLEYRMIVSLLRVRDFKMEDMLRRSFAEFHAQKAHPETTAKLKQAKQQLARLVCQPWVTKSDRLSKADATEYAKLHRVVQGLHVELQASCIGKKEWTSSLKSGAVILVSPTPQSAPQLSILLGSVSMLEALSEQQGGSKKQQAGGNARGAKPGLDLTKNGPYYVLSVHAPHTTDPEEAITEELFDQFSGMQPMKRKGNALVLPTVPKYGTSGKMRWALWLLDETCIVGFANTRPIKRTNALGALAAVKGPEFKSLLQQLSQLQDKGVSSDIQMPGSPAELFASYQDAFSDLTRHPAHSNQHMAEALPLIQQEFELQDTIGELTFKLSSASLQMLPEYGMKLKVLKDLGFATPDEVVKMKGRVACEISTCECLIATEAVFQGLFSDLDPPEAVALLSTLVNQHKLPAENQMTTRLTPNLGQALKDLKKLTLNLGVLQHDAGIPELKPEEFLEVSVRPSLVEVVYQWAKGTSFKEITDLSPQGVMEGDIVRTVLRLEQACQDLMSAARVMGNTTLYDQFEAGSSAIKRDIIFAGSLYIS